MQQPTYSYKTAGGKVSVELNGNALRLRYRWKGSQTTIPMGVACKEAFKAACNLANIVEYDIIHNCYDETKAKYHPKYAHKLEVLQQKAEPNIKELWELYKPANEGKMSSNVKKSGWEKIERLFPKVSSKALLAESKDLLIKEALEHYSAGTTRNIFAIISACSSWSFKQKLIKANHWLGIYKEVNHLLPPKKPIECFEAWEIEQIIKAFESDRYVETRAKFKHSYYLGYVKMLWLTGMRPEEVIALTWNDIITQGERKVIRISKAYSAGTLGSTKTGDTRMFPINAQLQALIDELPRIENEHNLIFPSYYGKHITQKNFQDNVFKRIIQGLLKDGLIQSDLTTYALRHSWITRMLQKGIDIKSVASLAGNSPEIIISNYWAAKKGIELPEI